MKKLTKVNGKTKRAKSSLLTAKSKANDQFKADTFSLSGLIRYAQNEGSEILKEYILEAEKRHEIEISANRLLTAKQILLLTKEKEKFNKDGSKRLMWSYWHVLNVVGRYAKELKGIEWNVVKTPKTSLKVA
jgi:hypothetical protein